MPTNSMDPARESQPPPGRVVVTGAAGAIGQALVEKFRLNGHKVFGLDIHPWPQDGVIDEFAQIDLQDLLSHTRKDTHPVISEILSWSDGAGLSALINNAAVQCLGSVEDLDLEAWSASLNVNLLAPFVLVQALLPRLESVKGCVVNVSSIHARLTKSGFVAYATSKAALSGMTRALAVELGDRIRVNAVEPASVETLMLKASFEGQEEKLKELAALHPLGRLATTQDVASLVYAIAMGDFGSLHGACVDISAGISARLHDPI